MDDAVSRARTWSPFLREAIARHSSTVATLAREGLPPALTGIRTGAGASPDFAAGLRFERSGISLALALADLAGWATFEDTVTGLTDFADSALDRAIREAMRERTGESEPTGFSAIALGKQGGKELNYSSDIDPIFLYEPATLPVRPREDAAQAAVRIARRVVELLQTRTGDGYVLRVDLRLRPSPEATPIALPIEAAIAYYESSAMAWERAAFIRARAAAGDIALGTRFVEAVQPFVWRRSLDFGALEEMTAISRRIRDEYPQGQSFGEGYDLKRGRGGIREIEFFTQIHQLIHGGRNPALRARATLDALAALSEAGHIEKPVAATLSAAYRTLRTIEHRLQMVDDRQTHSLPSGEALDDAARLHGLGDGEALLALLAPCVADVASIYDGLAGETRQGPRLPEEAGLLLTHLAGLGYRDATPAVQQVERWRHSPARSLRSPAARDAFETMLPALIEAVGRTRDPLRALHRFGDIVDRLPSGINLYRLLDARPALVGLLAQILGHAPALADQLARRPELLDGLIEATSFEPPPGLERLVAAFAGDGGQNYETRLDGVRRRVNDWRFALGVQLIAGRADPIEIAAGYARVAQAAVVALADAAIEQFAAAHGRVPGSELVILGLGRLGGGALTHASDLDVVYLFTGTSDAESDGAKRLRATDYFNRLARRVTAALSLPTAAGSLYEVDTRLRPSGIHGMLAVSLDAFSDYQASAAWTFEQMALTRARPVYGSVVGRKAADERIKAALTQPRDAAKCLADAVAMRSEIARHKPSVGAFDVKSGEGGLIDLEFAVQVRQLVTGCGLVPNLEDAVRHLVSAGFVPPEIVDAQRLLTRVLVVMRLVAPGGGTPDLASQPLVAASCGFEDWASLCKALSEARGQVAELWRRTVAQGVMQC